MARFAVLVDWWRVHMRDAISRDNVRSYNFALYSHESVNIHVRLLLESILTHRMKRKYNPSSFLVAGTAVLRTQQKPGHGPTKGGVAKVLSCRKNRNRQTVLVARFNQPGSLDCSRF